MGEFRCVSRTNGLARDVGDRRRRMPTSTRSRTTSTYSQRAFWNFRGNYKGVGNGGNRLHSNPGIGQNNSRKKPLDLQRIG
ncbi:hypothetical protein [Scytonema hofmannii]|uniref:hypothetical protein n=1 Tax=Scytonema hofmannii TaxID=34078 RepID=UPI0011DFA755